MLDLPGRSYKGWSKMKTTANLMTIAMLVLSTSGTALGARIALNSGERYQTIEGFGAFGAKEAWWSRGPYYDSTFLKRIIDTVGVTILRTELYPPEDEQNWVKQIDYWRAVKAYADTVKQPLKVIASVWTPPASFKTNGSTKDGGTLIMDKLDEYTDYLIDYLKRFRTECGFDLYALSPQNEPQLPIWYNSCTYTAENLGQVIVSLGRKIKSEGLPTKIFFSDDLFYQQGYNEKVQTVVSTDADADEVAQFLAMHYGGSDYLRDDLPDWYSSERCYKAYGDLARQHGKTAWNSEFGNGEHTWAIAFRNAQAKHAMLTNNYSAVVYWMLSAGSFYHEAVLSDGLLTDKGYCLMAFARHIRPGAIRIGCTSDDSTVRATAFVHEQQATTTVLLINTAQVNKVTTIEGTALLPETEIFQFSKTQKAEKIGTFTPGSDVTLTPQSVTVLYNQPISVAVEQRAVRAPADVNTAKPASARSYTLDGRCALPYTSATGRAGTVRPRAMAAGVYVKAAGPAVNRIEITGIR